MVSTQLTALKNVVETSYSELCFLLAVLLQNLHICSFLLILVISFYICTLRHSEVKSRIAGTWQPFTKMPCTNVHYLTPPSPPPNVQVKREGKREYVDSSQPGCKESWFYGLPFGQVVVSIYTVLAQESLK